MTITDNKENKEEMVRPWNKGAGDLRKVFKKSPKKVSGLRSIS